MPAAAAIVDLLVISAAALAAALGRQRVTQLGNADDLTGYATTASGWIVFGWICAIALFGGYSERIFGAGTDEYKRIANSSLVTASVTGIGCYLLEYPLSRGFFTLLFLLGIPMLLVARMILRRVVQRMRSQGHLRERVLIVGGPHHVDEIARVLARENWLGMHVVGASVPTRRDDWDTPVATPRGLTILGDPSEVSDHVKVAGATVVIFATGAFANSERLRAAVWTLEEQQVQILVAPSLTDVSSERVRVRPLGGLPLVHLEGPRTVAASHWAKRTFDLVGALGALLLFSPVAIFAAIWIKVHDGGPVLFRQTRIGRDGTPFSCLKFRSMVVDAEKMLPELLTEPEPHEVEADEHGLFKLKDDPRITGPGVWLRRFSIDELPQLINVVRGSMSMVGPRPPLPEEVERYSDAMMRRLRVQPGMTGLWQVSGRSDLSWEDTVRLDLYYVDNWSLLQDLSILVRTVSAVLRSRGAY